MSANETGSGDVRSGGPCNDDPQTIEFVRRLARGGARGGGTVRESLSMARLFANTTAPGPLTDRLMDEFVTAWVGEQVDLLAEAAVVDPMTGLLTGPYLAHRLAEALEHDKGIRYELVDVRLRLDGLHSLTDGTLRLRMGVARTLRNTVRPHPAALVSRDHYAVMVPATTVEETVASLNEQFAGLPLPAGSIIEVSSRGLRRGTPLEIKDWLHER